MRRSITLGFCILIAFAAFGQSAPKLSPLTHIYLAKLESNKGQLPDNYVYRKLTDNHTYVSALIKVGASPDVRAMNSLNVRVGTKAGNIWTVLVPVEQVVPFTKVAGIEYIQLDEPIHSALDSARVLTRVDSVHAGLGALPSQFHGSNVVVGIIDGGFDYIHPTLFDTTGTRYRVKRVWEQLSSGTPPSGFAYGDEITDTTDMWSTISDDTAFSHGAHVSGIAAGSGYGSASNSQFRGVSDGADIVLVGIRPPATDWTSTGMASIIDGMNYIFSYAASKAKPAVVNLSWGCSIGPHDGLSLFSQACDNLTGPGKIFVCSAGNNGDQKLHIKKSFTAADTILYTYVNFNGSLPQKRNWVDIWGDTSETFCVRLSLYFGPTQIDSTVLVCLDNQVHNVHMIGINNDTLFATISTSTSEFNGKTRMFIELYSKVSNSLMIAVKGNSGTINMWNGYVLNSTGYYTDFTTNSRPWATGGNTDMTIGDMASTRSALAVGAYDSKVIFTNVNSGVQNYSSYATYGALAPFSSHGPTADGRIKPDISAPGLLIGSAVNHLDPNYHTAGSNYSSVVYKWINTQTSTEYSYAMLMGTSMSSPMAAGIVGLMLEANPVLGPQHVQDALATTALTDNYTGAIPAQGTNTWGHGKINALAAVKRAMTITGIPETQQSSNLGIYPNPANDRIAVDYISKRQDVVDISVVDVSGRIVFRQAMKMMDGANTIEINTAAWSKGMYIVKIAGDGGTSVSRLVIQ